MYYLVFKIVSSYYKDFVSNFGVTFEKFFDDLENKEVIREMIGKILFEMHLEEEYVKKIVNIQKKELNDKDLYYFDSLYEIMIAEKIGKHKY